MRINLILLGVTLARGFGGRITFRACKRDFYIEAATGLPHIHNHQVE